MKNLKRQYILIIICMIMPLILVGQTLPKQQSYKVTTTDGVSIAYEVHGEGTTALVFVHGWSCDRSYWKEQIQPFSKQYKVISIDLGGHGESGFGRSDWTIFSFGNDVATVIKELKLNRVILIGHSMGGDVIVDAALQLPESVVGLVMVDTYTELGNGRSIEQIQTFVNELGSDFQTNVQNLVHSFYLPDNDSPLVDHIAKDMSLAPPEVALSALKSSFTHSRQVTHDLKLLKAPVIAINADHQQTNIESMESHGVEVVIMTRVGHFLMMEDPSRFNKILENTINKLLGN